MLHCLQVHRGPARLKKYLATVDEEQATAVADYARRVLARLSPDSDDDEEEVREKGEREKEKKKQTDVEVQLGF